MKRVVVGGGLVAVVVALALWHSSGSHLDDGTLATGSAPRVGHTAKVDPRKQPRASIAGTVNDETKHPIANARVCAISTSRNIAPALIRDPKCAISNASGGYTISNLVAARYEVSAMARTFQSAVFHPDDPDLELGPGERRSGVDLVLAHGGVEIEGTVSDNMGGTIAKAWVEISSESGNPAVETDEHGHYAAWVKEGSVSITANADGYAPGTNYGHAPGTIDVALTPGAEIAGIVVDASDHPVAGARVDVARRIDPGYYGPAGDITGEDGTFRIDRLLPARYTVVAQEAHGFGTSDGSIGLRLGQTVDGVVVRLVPAFRVEGKVVIAGSGQPCTDPYLGLSALRYGESLHAGSGAGGEVFAESALPGTYFVRVGCAGALARDAYPNVEVLDRDVTGLTWEVEVGGTIRGHVRTRDGAAIAGVDVMLMNGHSAKTLADGWYEIKGVAAGPQIVNVRGDHVATPFEPVRITMPPNGLVQQDFVGEDGARLVGVVVDDHGAPFADVIVYISPSGEHRNYMGSTNPITTDHRGGFELGPFPTGDYDVRVALDRDHVDQKIHLEAPATSNVRLILGRKPRASIHGVVIDATGAPVGDASVSAAPDDTKMAIAYRYYQDDQLTAPDGTFTISALEPGAYTLRATRIDGGLAYVEHIATGATATLQLVPTGTIEGTVRGARGELVVSAHDEKTGTDRSERFVQPVAHFVLHDLPAGSYRVVAHLARRRVEKQVELRAGGHETVDLELRKGVAVTGRVVDLATNAAIAGEEIRVVPINREYSAYDDLERTNVKTDATGRFRLEDIPPGVVEIGAYDMTSGYGYVSVARTIDGTSDVDVGDLGAFKVANRLDPDKAGKLGLKWVEFPSDTPSDQRRFEIATIDPKGPAAGLDVRVGDVVTSFDGIEAKPNNRSACWAIQAAPAGTAIRLGLARGPIVTVVLGPP